MPLKLNSRADEPTSAGSLCCRSTRRPPRGSRHKEAAEYWRQYLANDAQSESAAIPKILRNATATLPIAAVFRVAACNAPRCPWRGRTADNEVHGLVGSLELGAYFSAISICRLGQPILADPRCGFARAPGRPPGSRFNGRHGVLLRQRATAARPRPPSLRDSLSLNVSARGGIFYFLMAYCYNIFLF